MRLSRRDFLKKSVAGAIGVAAAGVVGIPAMAEEEKEALYIPGTYSATAKGYESDVKVTMTFTESKITEVVVDASGETAGIGSKAAEEMPQLILDAQSVDVVTSATASYTKDAIQKDQGCDPEGGAGLRESGADHQARSGAGRLAV